MAHKLQNSSVILDGRLKHVCKFWHIYASPACSDHNPSTGGDVGLIIYLPLKSSKGVLEPQRRGEPERTPEWVVGRAGNSWPREWVLGVPLTFSSTCQAPHEAAKPRSPRSYSKPPVPKPNSPSQPPAPWFLKTNKKISHSFSWILQPSGEATAHRVPKRAAWWSYSPSSTSPCTLLLSQFQTRYLPTQSSWGWGHPLPLLADSSYQALGPEQVCPERGKMIPGLKEFKQQQHQRKWPLSHSDLYIK